MKYPKIELAIKPKERKQVREMERLLRLRPKPPVERKTDVGSSGRTKPK